MIMVSTTLFDRFNSVWISRLFLMRMFMFWNLFTKHSRKKLGQFQAKVTETEVKIHSQLMKYFVKSIQSKKYQSRSFRPKDDRRGTSSGGVYVSLWRKKSYNAGEQSLLNFPRNQVHKKSSILLTHGLHAKKIYVKSTYLNKTIWLKSQ